MYGIKIPKPNNNTIQTQTHTHTHTHTHTIIAWASLVAQMVKNLPAMQETWI